LPSYVLVLQSTVPLKLLKRFSKNRIGSTS
jgi:hypothetical protein